MLERHMMIWMDEMPRSGKCNMKELLKAMPVVPLKLWGSIKFSWNQWVGISQ